MNECSHHFFKLKATVDQEYWKNVGFINKGPWVKSTLKNYYEECDCGFRRPIKSTLIDIKKSGDELFELTVGGNSPILEGAP